MGRVPLRYEGGETRGSVQYAPRGIETPFSGVDQHPEKQDLEQEPLA
jgi:hypothetical protein